MFTEKSSSSTLCTLASEILKYPLFGLERKGPAAVFLDYLPWFIYRLIVISTTTIVGIGAQHLIPLSFPCCLCCLDGSEDPPGIKSFLLPNAKATVAISSFHYLKTLL